MLTKTQILSWSSNWSYNNVDKKNSALGVTIMENITICAPAEWLCSRGLVTILKLTLPRKQSIQGTQWAPPRMAQEYSREKVITNSDISNKPQPTNLLIAIQVLFFGIALRPRSDLVLECQLVRLVHGRKVCQLPSGKHWLITIVLSI